MTVYRAHRKEIQRPPGPSTIGKKVALRPNWREVRMKRYFDGGFITALFCHFFKTPISKKLLCLMPNLNVKKLEGENKRVFDQFENELIRRKQDWMKNVENIRLMSRQLARAGKCVLDVKDWRKFRRFLRFALQQYLDVYTKPFLIKDIRPICTSYVQRLKRSYSRKKNSECTEEEARVRAEVRIWMELVVRKAQMISHKIASIYLVYANSRAVRTANRESSTSSLE